MHRNLYLALGDSITAGYGASHPSLTFLSRVAEYTLSNGVAQHTVVIAKNGWTCGDLVRVAGTVARSVWTSTNAITVMTGGNDLRQLLRRQFLSFSANAITPQLVAGRIQAFTGHLDDLCRFIHQQQVPYVVLATIYNPVPNYPLAVSAIQQLNDVIRNTSDRYHFGLVDVHAAFEQQQAFLVEGYRTGRLADLASPVRRPIHPNNAGHRTIADLFTGYFEEVNKHRHPKFHKKQNGD